MLKLWDRAYGVARQAAYMVGAYALTMWALAVTVVPAAVMRVAFAVWAFSFAFILQAVAWATDPVTLPDTGVDIAGLVTAAITSLGAILVVIVGGYFAFLLIRKAMRWGGRALG